MKQIITSIVFVFAVTVAGLAYAQQEAPPSKEKIEALKIAFITEKLNLSVEEAQQFWPVYNQYRKEVEALRKQHHQDRDGEKENLDSMSDSEIENMINNRFVYYQQKVDLKKKYYQQFKQILPIQKVAKYYRAEREFRMQLISKMRGHKTAK